MSTVTRRAGESSCSNLKSHGGMSVTTSRRLRDYAIYVFLVAKSPSCFATRPLPGLPTKIPSLICDPLPGRGKSKTRELSFRSFTSLRHSPFA